MQAENKKQMPVAYSTIEQPDLRRPEIQQKNAREMDKLETVDYFERANQKGKQGQKAQIKEVPEMETNKIPADQNVILLKIIEMIEANKV